MIGREYSSDGHVTTHIYMHIYVVNKIQRIIKLIDYSRKSKSQGIN